MLCHLEWDGGVQYIAEFFFHDKRRDETTMKKKTGKSK
jgi:hypothetical protein